MSHKNIIRNVLYEKALSDPLNPWMHKGDIERYMMGLGSMGDTTGRRLRELEESGDVISHPCGVSKQYRYAGPIMRPMEQPTNYMTDLCQET